MTMRRVDRTLPEVDGADVQCTACGQSIQTISGGGQLPDRHYPRPTKTRHRGIAHIGTTGDYRDDVCPLNRNDLTTLILGAQRQAAARKAGAA